MKKIGINLITALFLIIVFALTVPNAQGANLKDAFKIGGPLDQSAKKIGYNTGNRSLDPVISTIITVVLSFLGVIFLLLMIYGGFLWMTGGGNEQQVAKAKMILVAAVIGLIIVVAAYAITYLVINKVVEGSGLIT